ncbi:MAG TPA: P-II family nitrogen regulator [Candidatus Omnitrophota bacterium]|nr:P-II family nitrogen regulator [Candidatus Omnitrophota bacterium]HPB67444.1 P-II family nitrogen regulator [Candidatus Omnitrophota bacterium]HQO58238.1 P-II family nitrogen regulator [Candidatus Omnitrophota bacterium]
MKKVEAVIRKEKFQEVCDALEKSGFGGVTVLEARGFGRHRNGLQEKVKLEVYVDEFQIEKLVDLIFKHARMGATGDGKIAVVDLNNLYRIRTGEQGASAI